MPNHITDPIALHAHAMNCLSRCQHELLQPQCSYPAARAQLDAARQALLALENAESLTAH